MTTVICEKCGSPRSMKKKKYANKQTNKQKQQQHVFHHVHTEQDKNITA